MTQGAALTMTWLIDRDDDFAELVGGEHALCGGDDFGHWEDAIDCGFEIGLEEREHRAEILGAAHRGAAQIDVVPKKRERA